MFDFFATGLLQREVNVNTLVMRTRVRGRLGTA